MYILKIATGYKRRYEVDAIIERIKGIILEEGDKVALHGDFIYLQVSNTPDATSEEIREEFGLIADQINF